MLVRERYWSKPMNNFENYLKAIGDEHSPNINYIMWEYNTISGLEWTCNVENSQ